MPLPGGTGGHGSLIHDADAKQNARAEAFVQVTEAPEILVDARGHRCPVPTLRLRRALERALSGQPVRLIADDPLARIDVPHFVRTEGFRLLDVASDGDDWVFLVAKD